MVESKLDVPGNFLLVDHALSRLEKGLIGILIVEGEEHAQIYHRGPHDATIATKTVPKTASLNLPSPPFHS
jgi:hypothetical protein